MFRLPYTNNFPIDVNGNESNLIFGGRVKGRSGFSSAKHEHICVLSTPRPLSQKDFNSVILRNLRFPNDRIPLPFDRHKKWTLGRIFDRNETQNG